MGSGNCEPKYKVNRIIQKYELENMGEELENLWLGRGCEPHSLRKLSDYLNKKILRRKLTQSGPQPIPGEVKNIYQLLTSDDVNESDRVRARRTIERQGVDVDDLEEDFVSHQSIYTYLTEKRGVQKESNKTNSIDNLHNTIKKLSSRIITIIERSLGRARDKDEIMLGEFNVIVNISVVCAECGAHKNFFELLEEGGCNCD